LKNILSQRRGGAEVKREERGEEEEGGKEEEDMGLNENEIGTIVVDTAVNLHKKLGPGLLESVYEVILMKLLSN